MIIACPRCNPCLDPSEPTANYSTEDADLDHIFCFGSGNGALFPGTGRNWNVGECVIVWGPVSCFSLLEQGCQACVETNKWTCNPPPWSPVRPTGDGDPFKSPIQEPPPPGQDPLGPPVTRQTFWNFPATCTVYCHDASPFQYIVPAMRFAGWSQNSADQKAYTYACQEAAAHRLCLGDLSENEACINQPFSSTIQARGRYLSGSLNTWQVIGGNLPPGTELNGGAVYGGRNVALTGTPTTGGLFSFTVKVTAPTGDHMQKTYTVCVIAISPDTLPDGTVGTAYSETLTGTACATTPLSWQVSSGVLPPGLLLDEETGIIAGTPTTAGTYDFTILLQTEAT